MKILHRGLNLEAEGSGKDAVGKNRRSDLCWVCAYCEQSRINPHKRKQQQEKNNSLEQLRTGLLCIGPPGSSLAFCAQRAPLWELAGLEFRVEG